MDLLSYMVPITVYVCGLFFEVAYTKVGIDKVEEREKLRNKMNIWIGVLIFLIAALRGPGTGLDTGQYYSIFKRIMLENQPVSYYWNVVINGIKTGTFADGMFWNLFMKLASYVIRDAQIWLAFVSFLYLYSVYTVIDKYSDDPAISWLYIYFVFIFTFILQGLRQSVAMACVMRSFYYIIEKKPKKFAMLMGIAFLFHQSSIIFVIAYPLSKLKMNKGLLIAMVVAALCRFAPSVVLNLLGSVSENSRFAYYANQITSLSWSAFFIQLAIFAFCYYYREKDYERSELMTVLLNFSVMGMIFQSMTVIIAEMFRVSYYFNMFNMLLLANTCKGLGGEKYNQRYRIGVITLLFTYYLISGVYKYWFFWQR